MPVVTATHEMEQKDGKFRASPNYSKSETRLDNPVGLCLKTNKQNPRPHTIKRVPSKMAQKSKVLAVKPQFIPRSHTTAKEGTDPQPNKLSSDLCLCGVVRAHLGVVA